MTVPLLTGVVKVLRPEGEYLQAMGQAWVCVRRCAKHPKFTRSGDYSRHSSDNQFGLSASLLARFMGGIRFEPLNRETARTPRDRQLFLKAMGDVAVCGRTVLGLYAVPLDMHWRATQSGNPFQELNRQPRLSFRRGLPTCL